MEHSLIQIIFKTITHAYKNRISMRVINLEDIGDTGSTT